MATRSVFFTGYGGKSKGPESTFLSGSPPEASSLYSSAMACQGGIELHRHNLTMSDFGRPTKSALNLQMIAVDCERWLDT